MSKLSFVSVPLPVTPKLHTLLSTTLCEHFTQQSKPKDHLADFYTLHFKDSSYNAEQGGFHPIEIAIKQQASGEWKIMYITEFAFFGSYYPELERDVDFDIENDMAFLTGIGWQSLKSKGLSDFYTLWENNFRSYVEMAAYDVIKVNQA